MVTLSLFRHAKSAWNNPGFGDFDRPLAARGVQAAPRMGAYIEREGLVPDVVMCSAARRARQTLELAQAEWDGEPDVRIEEGLYGAGPGDMLHFVQALPARCAHAMLVGHNPGMHALAVTLCGDGEGKAMNALAVKFPTAALAVIEFNGTWKTVMPGAGHLRRFVVPRSLT